MPPPSLTANHCSILALLLCLAPPIVPSSSADIGAAVQSEAESGGQPGRPAASGAAERLGEPALALASDYEEGVEVSEYWVSEKLDGVRAYWDGSRLISRGGHPIQAPAWLTAGWPGIPLDGELWMGRGTFERLSGTVRRQVPDAEDWAEVRFMVFDLPAAPGTFGQRRQELDRRLAEVASPYLRAVKQEQVPDHAALMQRLQSITRAGGEGLVLHRDESHYRAGRSADLLKLKLHQDAEARVVAHLPGQGRLEGMLGSLLVEDEAGHRFRIGTGFTDAQRRDPPPVGTLVTYRYQGRTRRGIPRFASFLRMRDPE